MLVAHLYSLLVFLSFHDSLDVDAGQMDVFGSKRTNFHYLLHLGRKGGTEGEKKGGREGEGWGEESRDREREKGGVGRRK